MIETQVQVFAVPGKAPNSPHNLQPEVCFIVGSSMEILKSVLNTRSPAPVADCKTSVGCL